MTVSCCAFKINNKIIIITSQTDNVYNTESIVHSSTHVDEFPLIMYAAEIIITYFQHRIILATFANVLSSG